MKPSLLLCACALAAPTLAVPRYSHSAGGQWTSKYKEDYYDHKGGKKNHHHHSRPSGGGSEPTQHSAPYPSLTQSEGFEGYSTGTGDYRPSYTPPSRPYSDSYSGGDGGEGDGGSPTESRPEPSSSATSGNSSVTSSGGVSLPPGCQIKGNVGIGWLPGPSEKIGDIESALGVTACFDGQYAQITQQGAYSDSSQQLTPSISQLTGGKTIFVASVMPSIALGSVDSTVAGGVANVLKQFTDKNIEVWLRFAHEVNWYVTDGTYHGSADDFQKAWGAISAAVESNNLIKMFWSPNQASSGDLQQWYPTRGKVDMVGIDIYPKSQQSFGEVYGDFCKAFSTAKNLPFVIGETGAGPDLKEYWLGEIAKGDSEACPNYLGFSWFDYNKEADFRVVDGSDIAKRVLG